MAGVTLPVLGTNFLAHYHFFVDVAICPLVDTASLTTTSIDATPTEFALQIVEVTDGLANFRNTYPNVFKPELRQQPKHPSKQGIYHYIKTRGPRCSADFVVWPLISSLQQNMLSPSSTV